MSVSARHRLGPLLQPRSIAMVGASNQAGRIGGISGNQFRKSSGA